MGCKRVADVELAARGRLQNMREVEAFCTILKNSTCASADGIVSGNC